MLREVSLEGEGTYSKLVSNSRQKRSYVEHMASRGGSFLSRAV